MIFLLANVALAFYNVGIIWAHEVDIFRSWTLLDVTTFRAVQAAHWKRLPYWVFVPVGLSFVGAVVLVWNHPAGSPYVGDLGEPRLPTAFAHPDRDDVGSLAG